MKRRADRLLALALVTAFGCVHEEQDAAEGPHLDEAIAFEKEVVRAINDLQQELVAAEVSIRAHSDETWATIRSRFDTTRSRTIENVDRLGRVGPEHEAEIRTAIATELSRLSADVAKAKVASAVNAENLRGVVSTELGGIEALLRKPGDQRSSALLRTLESIRAQARTIDASDGLDPERDTLSAAIAELELHARALWYRTVWSLEIDGPPGEALEGTSPLGADPRGEAGSAALQPVSPSTKAPTP